MKRFLAFAALALMLLTCPVKVAANGLLGDVNGDHEMNITDVTELINYLTNNDGSQLVNPDVSLDDMVNITDVTMLINMLLNDNGKKTFVVNGVLFSMMPVEGGTFKMGSNDSEFEKPIHNVTLSSYYMGETEVTQALWKAVTGKNPSTYKGDNMPVQRVSWDDCQSFILKLNQFTGFTFRMPTEAEWEFAARGGNLTHGYKYSGSNTLAEVGWYNANSGNTPHDVATLAPNELGIYDMSGNVREWVWDWYHDYTSAAQTNPTGPNEEDLDFKAKVERDGAFNTYDTVCHVTNRASLQQNNSSYMLGMRLAIVLE
jgi:formylglycine-generating enzyme required for sulfatase activity